MNALKQLEIKQKIFQKGDKNHQDSFWYDGEIAELEYKNRVIRVIAEGKIRIIKKNGELVFDGKERNSGFNFKLEKDSDLKKIGNTFDDDYYWDENNWFGFIYRKKSWKEDRWKDIIGDVCHEYNNAIKYGKNRLKDDGFWKLFE